MVDESDEVLYNKHAEELIRFATTLVGPSLAEDVFTNAVIKVMTGPAWPSVSERRAYLFRAVVNEARMLHRSDRRRAARESRTALPEARQYDGVSLEVRDAVERLSARERAVLHLAYWHDASVAEISVTLELSRRSVERALTSARHRLEEQLR